MTRYEKGLQDPPEEMRYVDYGLSVWEREIVESMVPQGAVADLADSFRMLSQSGQLAGLEMQERFYEIGSSSGPGGPPVVPSGGWWPGNAPEPLRQPGLEMPWPKERALLTDEQSAIMADWIHEFLTSVKSTRFGWVSRFDHTFPARSASSALRTLEIGAGTGTHVPFESTGEYVALEASAGLVALIHRRDGLSVVVADCEQRLPWDDDSFDRVLAIHVLEHLYNLAAALKEDYLSAPAQWCLLRRDSLRRGRPLLARAILYDETDV